MRITGVGARPHHNAARLPTGFSLVLDEGGDPGAASGGGNQDPPGAPSAGDAAVTQRRNPLRVTLNPAPVWAFLEEREMSQNELARLAGISPGYLSQLMSGAPEAPSFSVTPTSLTVPVGSRACYLVSPNTLPTAAVSITANTAALSTEVGGSTVTYATPFSP